MLGICTTSKEELNTFSTEMVYGAIYGSGGVNFKRKVRHKCQKVSCATEKQCSLLMPYFYVNAWSSIPNDLHIAKFAFARRDARQKPPQLPYDGPYEVIHPVDKSFQLLIGGRQDMASIDRLKLAHLDVDGLVEIGQPPNRGCSGNTPICYNVQSPKRPSNYTRERGGNKN
uniref:Uncharacterized protein n=1 Tax=Octopus bimaculoides TaxID=37653 RepID=A0A0L8I9L6_OCTBM